MITQRPCIRKSMSFEGQQHKIEHNGNRKKFSVYISMLWPDQRLMYDFYDKMNSTNTMAHLEKLRKHVMNTRWKRLVLIWDNASFHVSKMTNDYIKAQKHWLTIIYLPKKAPYLNPNERKVNQQIKSCVCTNRFYEHIEDQKTAVSEFLDNRFEIWNNDI
jgi:DDE superfamily endonuclease